MKGGAWKRSDLLNLARRNKIRRNVALDGIAKKTKYRNKKVVYDSIPFDSLRERNHYLVLRQMRDKGKIIDLECHKPFELHVNGVKIGKYIADFSYMENNQHVVVDVKSKPTITALYRWKKKHMMAEYGIKIIEVL